MMTLLKHYYYIEKLTTMKYYDLKKVESRSFIENKEDKNSLIKLFKGILNHLLVSKDLINKYIIYFDWRI